MSVGVGPIRLPRSRMYAAVGLPLALLACGICALYLRARLELPAAQWLEVRFHAVSIDDLTLRYSVLPRATIALVAGGALALSGFLFQQVLRNPLAEPTTLGASAGAQLFITIATLYAPTALAIGQDYIALAGAAAATAVVFFLAQGRSLSPMALILAGLIVSLVCGSAIGILNLFAWQYLTGVFVWSAGALVQNDWSAVLYLLPRVTLAALVSSMLVRALSVMAVGDEGARSLGLSPGFSRFLLLTIAVSLAAFVVCAVGTIGFVGLAGPALARLSGARRIRHQMLTSTLWGGGLLLLADQGALSLTAIISGLSAGIAPGIPAGVATAVLGAPLMLWLLPAVGRSRAEWGSSGGETINRSENRGVMALAVLLALATMSALAIVVGQGQHGWAISTVSEVLQLRWPRVVAALASGLSLGAAGAIMQRTFANPMAAPEVLGVSSGASAGLILTLFLVPLAGQGVQVSVAALGAFIALLSMLFVGRRNAYSPERIVLTGVIITTIFSALVSFLMASGDPRLGMLLTWLSGSTYRATPSDAITATIVAGIALVMVSAIARWLEILPLGDTIALEVGLGVRNARLFLLVVTAILTASSTLIVGPLTFVGLMAPHLARLAGLQRPFENLIGAAAFGALTMVLADWLGRNVMFPYQIPAGLLAALMGAPYFLFLMRRRSI